MTLPFKVVASDVVPIGTVLFVPPVTIERFILPNGDVAEKWTWNPKAAAVIKNVGEPDANS